MNDTPPIAELKAVSKSYRTAGGHELKVLDDIDLSVHEGELLALLGQSGSGKSTILRCLTGLVEPTAGRVLASGKPLAGVNSDASIVFQTFALYPWLTVAQNVAVGLMSRRMSRAERDSAVERAIDLIGLGNYHAAYPRELSGGMRQRVGMARALVSQPRLLCLDEAFSALDVLTAENLRQELIALWRSREHELSSIFMVTHNIEEAVEMATRVVVLFPHPGRLGLVLEIPLPYPRDTKSSEFQRLVGIIHECITTMTLPDLPPEPPPAAGQPISRAHTRMESIPYVPVAQILGLMKILHDSPELSNIYEISDEIGTDFGETISIVKAADILDLVDTPKHDVLLTELGRRFVVADREGQRQIFAQQVDKLRLFHIILALLAEHEEVEAERIVKDIATALPYDNPDRTFETMIAWGRYAGLMDLNPKTQMVFVPRDEEATGHAAAN
ncbi:nitrate/sulfonate/bicarbonate ABC transporter ATP-binding protein [Variovorax sp. OV329]|uniref:ABC transporter ATP-binding protein n=1 Tax=Variovorax sp. OV329 TaxID=1882825 RepID=UPI0008F3F922|nr:nitrate/sulfonate/bicarbonate ABC transporter ATP-binding protein [Variovorax sp. OV329]SFM63515.1 NitT/TauT family transport system ATP-binding protein [Variovorax sp. OV329]